ncbi:MAG: PHP domain-containing protein [Candidatus Auribacterota bacterium]|nr:PHP domain-containing protein [Candidatus Auribacterota bacterium]
MFTHLHCHFLGSYSDSVLVPDRALARVRELGQEAIAITDHGVIDYCYTFYQACRRNEIKPILGCEVYFVDDARASIAANDSYRNHLILLARSNRGYENLVKLVNRSWLDNNFGETRGLVDWKLLEEFNEGLIVLSACFWGSLPQKYITEGREAAEKEFAKYYDIFGKDFYPELGRHGIPDEEKANQGLIALSKRFGVTPVVTNDTHYLQPRDWQFHDVIIKTRFGYGTDFELDVRNYYLKSEEEMRDLGFPPEYYDMTMDIARQCRVTGEVFAPDPGEERFKPEGEAVFSSKQVVIDGYQALKDVTAAWKIRDRELQDILQGLPRGVDLARGAREVPALNNWLKNNPRIREAAGKLVGIPRRSRPDFSTVIDLPLERIRDILPVRRARGEIMAAYPTKALEELGIPLRTVASFSDTAPDFYGWVKQLTMMAEARDKYDEGDFTSAAILLEGIIKVNSDDLEAHYLLAETYYRLKKFAEAIFQYEFLEESNYNPWRMPLLLTRKGWAYSWLKQSDKARKSFEKAVSARGDYAPPRYALGVLNYRQGRYREAIELFNIFLKLRPEGKQADKARGIVQRLRR